tara:strand:- start:387 stop:1454 length:1068 start_codon:yes stop_codon:yes gene_type:complete
MRLSVEEHKFLISQMLRIRTILEVEKPNLDASREGLKIEGKDLDGWKKGRTNLKRKKTQLSNRITKLEKELEAYSAPEELIRLEKERDELEDQISNLNKEISEIRYKHSTQVSEKKINSFPLKLRKQGILPYPFEYDSHPFHWFWWALIGAAIMVILSGITFHYAYGTISSPTAYGLEMTTNGTVYVEEGVEIDCTIKEPETEINEECWKRDYGGMLALGFCLGPIIAIPGGIGLDRLAQNHHEKNKKIKDELYLNVKSEINHLESKKWGLEKKLQPAIEKLDVYPRKLQEKLEKDRWLLETHNVNLVKLENNIKKIEIKEIEIKNKHSKLDQEINDILQSVSHLTPYGDSIVDN